MNCSPKALPCPNFGNINNSDATAFEMTDRSRVFNLILDATEVDRLNTIIQKYRDLHELIGHCGNEYQRLSELRKLIDMTRQTDTKGIS